MNWWQRVLLGLLLLAHWMLTWGLVALMAAYGPSSKLHVAATSGVFLGQGVLASLWLVCLRDSRWWRGLCVLLLAAWAWLAMILGTEHRESLGLMGAFFMGMPIMLCILAASGVLSVAWWIFRWEIRSPGDDGSSPSQFSLRRSLAMVAMACVLLAVARNFVRPADQSDGAEFEMLSSELLMFLLWVAITSIAFTVNCCAMLPMIAAMFRSQEHWLRWTLVLLFVVVPAHGLVVAIVEGVLVALLADYAPGTIGMLMTINTAQLLTIVLSLACLRAIGFRFERSPGRRRPEKSAGDTENSDKLGPATPPSDYYPHGVL